MEGMLERIFARRDEPSAGPFRVRIVRPVGQRGDGSWEDFAGRAAAVLREKPPRNDPRTTPRAHHPRQTSWPSQAGQRPAGKKILDLGNFRPEQDQLATL